MGGQDEASAPWVPQHRRDGRRFRRRTPRRERPQNAARANGFHLKSEPAAALTAASMNVPDFEPMWSPAHHALTAARDGTLALAEARGATGSEILTALAKGVEMQVWIRQASG